MKGKIYTKSVVDVSSDAGEFFCFSARDWEGVSRNLLSLVELYQRIWIWNLDQNLIMALLIVNAYIMLF